MISDIELMMNDSISLFESIRSHLEIWREKISTKKKFKEEWQEFVTNARKLIKNIMLIEENFFLKLLATLEILLKWLKAIKKA